MNEDTQSSNLQIDNDQLNSRLSILQLNYDHLNSIISKIHLENIQLKHTISRLEYEVEYLKSLQEHQKVIIKPPIIKPTLIVKPTKVRTCGKIGAKQTIIHNTRRDYRWLHSWLNQ